MSKDNTISQGSAQEPLSRRAYSVPETAAMLGVHPATVYRLINAGELASLLAGGCRRIPDVALNALLSSASVGPLHASEPERSKEASRRRRMSRPRRAADAEPVAAT